MQFGILCNGFDFQQWQSDCIENLLADGHSCNLLIVNDNTSSEVGLFNKLKKYPYSKFIVRFWFRFLNKPKAKQSINLSGRLGSVKVVRCKTRKKGFAGYFEENDIEKIHSSGLDFILRFGFGILKGGILDAAKYGIWSYHHDDDKKYRGVPTGFWEIMYNDAVNAVILQKLTDKVDSGVILRKGYFKTIDHSWQANLDNLLKSACEWPSQVCRDIENGNTAFLSTVNKPESKIYHLPSNGTMIKFLLKVVGNKIRFHFKDIFVAEKWQIGMLPTPFEDFIYQSETNIPEPIWLNLSQSRSTYHADPFGIYVDGKYHILCEEYDYKSRKGVLVSIVVNPETKAVERKELALEKKYHLAYPYLFHNEGDIFCLPENSAGNNLDLYRYIPHSGKLVFDRTLIRDIKAVDQTLFNHNGIWWLFFTDIISTNERLNIWYSDSLTGEFKPHRNNPVKTDIRSSRPAGAPFYFNSHLLRPSQDCSLRSGWRIMMNEILVLTPTEFIEKEYSIINPPLSGPSRAGMHTFSHTSHFTVVDAKKEVFIPESSWFKIITKIKKLF